MLASATMTATTPVVDVATKTVTHAGKTVTMSPHSDDSFDVLVAGVPVGRVIFSFAPPPPPSKAKAQAR